MPALQTAHQRCAAHPLRGDAGAVATPQETPAVFSGPPRRITDEMIDEVRRRRSAGELMADLAREFGISVPAVSRIVNRAGRYANRGSTNTEPRGRPAPS